MKIGIRAWIDFAFRKIFGKPGNEICLISLLNAVLGLPRPVVSIEYLNPFGFIDFETDKLVCVDVKATDEAGRIFCDRNPNRNSVEFCETGSLLRLRGLHRPASFRSGLQRSTGDLFNLFVDA